MPQVTAASPPATTAHRPLSAEIPDGALLDPTSLSPLAKPSTSDGTISIRPDHANGLLTAGKIHGADLAAELDPDISRTLQVLRDIVQMSVRFIEVECERTVLADPLELSLRELKEEAYPGLRATIDRLANECRTNGHKEFEFGLRHLNHDLGTLCTRILGRSETLVEDFRNGIFDPANFSNVAERLVSALNKFPSNPTAVQRAVELEEVCFSQLEKWVCGMVRDSERYLDTRKHFEFCSSVGGDAQTWDQFPHRGVAMRAVGELIRNGARSMNNGGSRIEFSADIQPKQITLTVKDCGRGIDPSLLPRIFEPGVSTRENGGMGLAIVAESVAHMAGAIRVSSKVGEGSSFTLLLPTS